MLITRSIIRRLLLREYSEYFGKEFVEFKSNFKQGENPLVIAEEMGLQKIGSGSTRVVYGLRDNPEFVLKIINTNVKMETDVEDIHGFSKHHKKLSNLIYFFKEEKILQKENQQTILKKSSDRL